MKPAYAIFAVYLESRSSPISVFRNAVSDAVLPSFSPTLVEAYRKKIANMIPKSNRFQPNAYLIETLNRLDESAPTVAKKGLLYSICAAFDEGTEYTDRTFRDTDLLYKIFEFIESNFSGDCTLHDLAAKTGFSYSYLSRTFKSILGISFNTYVNRQRINNACYLLANTEKSILECAYESGYHSLRSFNRNFKELLSVTPQEYRSVRKNR